LRRTNWPSSDAAFGGVRFWHLADIVVVLSNVRFWG
jgi:hypothetical protein